MYIDTYFFAFVGENKWRYANEPNGNRKTKQQKRFEGSKMAFFLRFPEIILLFPVLFFLCDNRQKKKKTWSRTCRCCCCCYCCPSDLVNGSDLERKAKQLCSANEAKGESHARPICILRSIYSISDSIHNGDCHWPVKRRCSWMRWEVLVKALHSNGYG